MPFGVKRKRKTAKIAEEEDAVWIGWDTKLKKAVQTLSTCAGMTAANKTTSFARFSWWLSEAALFTSEPRILAQRMHDGCVSPDRMQQWIG
jgi:hypothetical protein